MENIVEKCVSYSLQLKEQVMLLEAQLEKQLESISFSQTYAEEVAQVKQSGLWWGICFHFDKLSTTLQKKKNIAIQPIQFLLPPYTTPIPQNLGRCAKRKYEQNAMISKYQKLIWHSQ